MKNSNYLTGLVLAASLVGCDEPGDLLIQETEIQGPVKVRLYQEKVTGDDTYRLEVYDQDGDLRVNYPSSYLPNGTMIVDENGKTYNVVDGKRFYSEDSKSGKVNKINN